MYNIFEGREEYIAEKKIFFGKLPINVPEVFDWNKFMYLLDTHPEERYDRNPDKFRIGLNNFHARPSAPDFARLIVEEMIDVFSLHKDMKITNIAFSGYGYNSGSYPWHKDSMDVFLVQAVGDIGLRVEGHNNEEEFIFSPGDYVWLPRGTHHQIVPRKSRVTFSFGVEGDPDPSVYF